MAGMFSILRAKKLLSSVLVLASCACSSNDGSTPSPDAPTQTPAPKTETKAQPAENLDWIWRDYSAQEFPDLVTGVKGLVEQSNRNLTNDLIEAFDERLQTVVLSMREVHEAQKVLVENPNTLKVATLNAALLCVTNLVFNQPTCEVRRPYLRRELAGMLSEDGLDILMLQEVWSRDDNLLVRSIAEENGYSYVEVDLPEENTYGHGLQILYRNETFGDSNPVVKGFLESKRAAWERLAQVERGILYAALETEDGVRFLAAVIHHTPDTIVPDFYRRDQQRAHLTEEMAELAAYTDYFLIAGDFNYTAEFVLENRFNILDSQLGGRTYIKYAEDNTDLRLVDTYRVTNLDAGYTWDERFNSLLQRTELVGSRKRLDMIWLGSADDASAYTVGSSLIHTAPLKDESGELVQSDGKNIHLSDHFGLISVIHYETD